MRVKNAWAQIDTQLKRRFDLIPNLVETVKGYAAHEQGTLEKVIAARNTYTSANTVEEKAKANNELTSTLKNIFALGEAYPELKANENFLALQTELAGTEDKVAYSRQFYNDTVQMYNTAIMKFPNNLVAGMFGHKEEPFFTIDEAEKEPVKVQF
jgi:LemA protein